MKHLLNLSIVAACLTTTGCRSVVSSSTLAAQPAASAPSIPLNLVSSSRVLSIKVDFDDQRPQFERHYYPGTCEPTRWHDAVSMVPMEAFEPNIEPQLCECVAAAVEEVCPDAQRATLTLTSFQFAFDQRENVQGEYMAKYVNWSAGKEREADERDVRREKCDDDRTQQQLRNGDSFGSMIFSDIIMATLTATFVDLPRALLLKHDAKKRTEPKSQTLPTEITDGKQKGLNCQIHGVIMTMDRYGEEHQWTVEVDQHAAVSADGSLGEQTARFMEAALVEFSTSAVRSAHSNGRSTMRLPDASSDARH